MKNIIRISLLTFLLTPFFMMQSCVSSRKFEDVKKEKDSALKKQSDCSKKNEQLEDTLSVYKKLSVKQKEIIGNLTNDTALLATSNRKITLLNKQINDLYEQLLLKVKELEGHNKLRSSELSTELQAAKKRLQEQEEDLKKRMVILQKLEDDNALVKKELESAKTDLAQREKKVKELQSVLDQKDSVVNQLKNTVQKALLGYKDKGLTVDIKNGKVYLSVDEKLLFESGKYAVNATGKQALKDVAEILKKQDDLNIMVEGHTDNVAIKAPAGAVIKDNWDLSVMRATEVTKIFISAGLDPTKVTASGKGETKPIADNSIADGRAKNRRTEIILTPKLDELFKILE